MARWTTVFWISGANFQPEAYAHVASFPVPALHRSVFCQSTLFSIRSSSLSNTLFTRTSRSFYTNWNGYTLLAKASESVLDNSCDVARSWCTAAGGNYVGDNECGREWG